MNATNGIISQSSPYAVSETIDRLVAVLRAKGITIFAALINKWKLKKLA